ncbi:unnamed protein product [Cuscuta europaea]|uniref:Fatty acyl-CoA reductase n=1 Tax=Cuscuta europaea TaxID=41803 RepID=A0A9P1EBM6_CUSEU|nr:unnamed protein product [Cuscuta europaea]
MEFLVGKSILITGATGFLAKVLVEKILRTQPDIKKLYLLIRANDSVSAIERFKTEVIDSELFRVVKEKYGDKFKALVEEKVFPVAGDISFKELGIQNDEQLSGELDIIINSAATTIFDERYDVAMSINTMGAANVLSFAKKCHNLKMIVHVSTAYVCGDRIGIILERPFHLGETLNEHTNLDIDEEKKVIEDKLMELRAQNATEKQVRVVMKILGIQRTMDIFVLMYGKGKSNFMIGDPNTILDAIPGDMVVNSILAAIVHHGSNLHHTYSDQELIYHVGSSTTNPLTMSDLGNCLYRYFTDYPWSTKSGDLVRVRKPMLLTSLNKLHRYISLHYLPMLKVLKLLNMILFHYFDEKCATVEKNISFVMRLAELYKPYLFFYGSFDDTNTKRLRMATTQTSMTDIVKFDPTCIQWEDYFITTHIPGVVKYAF